MMQRLIIISSTVFGTLVAVNSVHGQIIPDLTTNTSTTDNCQTSCDLTGGTLAGDNLFHSFQEFNVAPEASVYFNDPGVANIFSRVTGSNPSKIFGKLGVKGGANLFLLNPNGIVFGRGASLDLNGSFLATTADEIQFGDRNFSAVPQQENLALLTVNPSALLFNQIGQAGSIVLDGADLTVPQQQNIALLGQGNDSFGIELKNSSISVTEGNISLGAVENKAEVALSEDFQLELTTDVSLADISIVDGSRINSFNFDSSAQREISINSKNLRITGDSQVSTTAFGTDNTSVGINGADINIEASSSIKITGTGAENFQKFIAASLNPQGNAVLDSGLQTNTVGIANAGNIQIKTPELSIDRGGGIISATNDRGNSGNINLDVGEGLTLTSSALVTGSNRFSSGNVGEINLNTQQLLIEQNSVISSSTLGSGNAGNISIIASEAVEIKDTLAKAIIPTGIFTNTIFEDGNGGNLNINTPRLILQNGGQLSASSGAIVVNNNGLNLIRLGGVGGDIDLQIGKSLAVEGISVDGRFPSSIISDTRSDSPAGNVTIDTSDLDVSSGGLISTSSLGKGAGGNITIDASNSVNMDGGEIENILNIFLDAFTGGEVKPSQIGNGIVAFTVADSEAGSVEIETNTLNLDRGAIVSTTTFGNGSGGNLAIRATEKINLRGSAIISPTSGTGNGGNIDLETKTLDISKGGGIISVTTGRGRAGNIKILATESIAIFDIAPNQLFSGTISTGSYAGTGASGDLTIDTQRLTLKDGGNIEATNISLDFDNTDTIDSIEPQTVNLEPQPQGQLTINATDSIEISDVATEANEFSLFPNSHIYSITNTSNPASNIEINTGKLSISDGGEISVRSFGIGAAGALTINADSVILDNEGNINGTTVSGRGGNIDLQIAEILELGNNSIINTNATEGNGGNINIAADFVIASSASSIAAQALFDGIGGNINITANDIFLSADSSVNADSALGIDGTVELKTLINTERNNLTQLPQKVVRADNKITRSCNNIGDRQGVFSYTGRGGLPFNPLTDFQTDEPIIADLDIPSPVELKRQIQPEINSKLDLLPAKTIEANGWQVNARGKIELTADNNSTFGFAAFYCPLAPQSS